MRKLRHIHIKIVFLNHLYHTKTPLPHMGKVTQSIDWIKINLSFVHYVPTQNSFEYGHIWLFVSYGFNKIKSSHKKIILMQSTFILVALEWISFCILFSAIKFIMKFCHPSYWLQFVTTFFISYSDYTNLKQWSSSEEGVSVRTPLYLRCLHYCKIMGN